MKLIPFWKHKKRMTKTFGKILINKFFITSVLMICLAAGILAASYYLHKVNHAITSARVENKPEADSLMVKRSLPCNRYYNEVLMY